MLKLLKVESDNRFSNLIPDGGNKYVRSLIDDVNDSEIATNMYYALTDLAEAAKWMDSGIVGEDTKAETLHRAEDAINVMSKLADNVSKLSSVCNNWLNAAKEIKRRIEE